MNGFARSERLASADSLAAGAQRTRRLHTHLPDSCFPCGAYGTVNGNFLTQSGDSSPWGVLTSIHQGAMKNKPACMDLEEAKQKVNRLSTGLYFIMEIPAAV